MCNFLLTMCDAVQRDVGSSRLMITWLQLHLVLELKSVKQFSQSEPPQPLSLLALPSEVLCLICTYLDLPTISRLSMVCRTLRRISLRPEVYTERVFPTNAYRVLEPFVAKTDEELSLEPNEVVYALNATQGVAKKEWLLVRDVCTLGVFFLRVS